MLGKVDILHKKSGKFYKTLKENIKTTNINFKRNSVSKKENSTTQIDDTPNSKHFKVYK